MDFGLLCREAALRASMDFGLIPSTLSQQLLRVKKTNHRDAENAEEEKREILKLGLPSNVDVAEY